MLVGHAGLQGVGPLVGRPQLDPDVALWPDLQCLRPGVVRPVEYGEVEWPGHSRPVQRGAHDLGVGEMEHTAHVEEHRLDHAAERPET